MRKTALSIGIGALLLLITGCKTYHVSKPGYMVQGDDYFYNIEEEKLIYVGPNFRSNEKWRKGKSPLNTKRLRPKHRRLLNRLGYQVQSHHVLLRNASHLNYDLLVVTNKNQSSNQISDPLTTLMPSTPRQTEFGTWYYTVLNVEKTVVYHALFSPTRRPDKYYSLIYIFPEQHLDTAMIKPETMEKIEHIMTHNLYMVNSIELFSPAKFVSIPPADQEAFYHEYNIIEDFKDFRLLKLYTTNEESRNLTYYRLIRPGMSLGAFKIYEGDYLMEYTTLKGKVLWKDQISIGSKNRDTTFTSIIKKTL